MLYSRPVDGVPCKFRTCYDTTLWPMTVTAAEWKTPDRLQPAIKASDAAFALRLELRFAATMRRFRSSEMDHLRFHLIGESSLVHIALRVAVLQSEPHRGARSRQSEASSR